jgi:superfamily II helicase
MSETPRTDRDTHRYGDASVEWIGEWVPACACRIIERELNAANESFRKLNIHTLNLVDRIRRLEDAGDALYENSDPTRWDSLQAANRKLNDQEAWRKAKEAKP